MSQVRSHLLPLQLLPSHLPAVLLYPANNKALNLGHSRPPRHPGELCGAGNEFCRIIISGAPFFCSRLSSSLRGDLTIHSLVDKLTPFKTRSLQLLANCENRLIAKAFYPLHVCIYDIRGHVALSKSSLMHRQVKMTSRLISYMVKFGIISVDIVRNHWRTPRCVLC